MALSKRAQVALSTLAVFVVSLAGLLTYSLSTVTGRSELTTIAEIETSDVSFNFEPVRLTGKVGETGVVVDLLAQGSSAVLASRLTLKFVPQLVAVREVNSDAGIFGGATIAFDSEKGLLALSFTPGKAVKPTGRIASLILEFKSAGLSQLSFVGEGSEVSVLPNGVLKRQQPSLGLPVAIEITSP